MIIWLAGVLFTFGGCAMLWAANALFQQTVALREECQMMRVARSASSQCPLVGHVKINASNVI